MAMGLFGYSSVGREAMCACVAPGWGFSVDSQITSHGADQQHFNYV